MSKIGDFLRNYEFLNITKSVTENSMALYKEPNETWAQIGNKLYRISWNNSKAIATVGLDVTTYLFLSAFRSCGLFLPPEQEPPQFPVPHDNIQFLDHAIQRALWDWKPEIRQEMEEGIQDAFSNKWNIFQVVGEWSLAYSYENGKKSSYFQPNFLKVSEPLENGASFRSVGAAFASLKPKDRKAILNAIYHQTEAKSLSTAGKKIYQDMRALASLLHQGNHGYLNAFSEYAQQKAASNVPLNNPLNPSVQNMGFNYPKLNEEQEQQLYRQYGANS